MRTGDSRVCYPCFYGGGGSCAFDRSKFLELGGFDELLAPFYLEDTDLGYLAWKRGWKVLYQPASVVYHEHRGTIGKHFSDAYIQSRAQEKFPAVHLEKHPRVAPADRTFLLHLGQRDAELAVRRFAGARRISRASRARRFSFRERWFPALRARRLAAISDTEAFRRPLGGHFRDTFSQLPARPDRLRVLFVSPYPICPPVHGGGVFMYQTVRELARLCELHLIVLLDLPAAA